MCKPCERRDHFSFGTLISLWGQNASLGQLQYWHRKDRGLMKQKTHPETDPWGRVEIYDQDGVPNQWGKDEFC